MFVFYVASRHVNKSAHAHQIAHFILYTAVEGEWQAVLLKSYNACIDCRLQ